MNRRLIASLIVITSVVAPSPSFAQDPSPTPGKSKGRPFKPAGKADGDAAVGIEVAPAPREVTVLKQFPVNQSGEANFGLTPGVYEVDLKSNGIARWKFYLWNRTERPIEVQFDMTGSYVADKDGKTYRSTGKEYSNNHSDYYIARIQAGTRLDFYLEFAAPTQPNKDFKIGILAEPTINYAKVRPFTVTLTEPLYFSNGVFEAKKAAPVPGLIQGRPGSNRDGNGDAGGPAGPDTPHVCPTPKQSEEREQKFRDLSEGGHRIDGNLFLSRGTLCFRGRIIFKQRERGDFVEATIVTLDSPQTFEIWGAFFEEPRTESGLVLKLRDNAKVVYTLKLEGNTLSGTDTLGNRYSFLIRAKN